ncbi:MAG: 50S ribosomal protein L11 methyltransferase [Chloroflexota bacterium]|nr:50S ribosomal protein L11 methyltransferase [Chloroflexota bacterium]MDE2907882.1 50S ribosomal protein L11 methyltransferase [Chloroflexota bacterium]
MSRWIEVCLRVDGESAEAIAEVLARYGHQGVSIEQAGIPPDTWDESEVPPAQALLLRAYIADDEQLENTKTELETALAHMRLIYPMPQPAYRTLESEDWSEAWKAHYQPMRIGRRLLIRPLWIETETAPGEIVIALDPGMAFGTGTHPTTQICLEALERLIKPAQDVLDLGSGSGILAIAAAKLGARQVLALDIDPLAASATAENARANGVGEKIIAKCGGLDSVLGGARRFDLVMVNILARVILQLSAQGLGEIVRPGGAAIFSGIIDSQQDEVEAALERAGLQIVARHQQGDWMLVEARRPAE